jgi:deoxyxylulose-5-phosphate synthase
MPDKILDSIHNPEDLRKLSVDQLPQLADVLRQFIT